MTLIDYTELNPEPLTLRLEQELGGNYIVLDARDGNTVYYRLRDLADCERWMRVFAEREGALVDERSIRREQNRLAGRAVGRRNVVPIGRRSA